MKLKQPLMMLMLSALCILTPPAIAQTQMSSTSQVHNTEIISPELLETQRQADAWGLKTEEWQRYQELMEGPLGLYSPGIDPLTALGIESRSDEERRYYAELQVRAESRRVEKELAYQVAYDQAWKRLYPALLPLSDSIDSTVTLSGDGRLALFVQESCLPCDLRVKQMQAAGDAFDIYFVGSQNDDGLIRRWANSVGIDPQKVLSRTITLNHDSGKWQALGVTSQLPAAVKEVNGRWILH